jgi:site-specific DNA recombinase
MRNSRPSSQISTKDIGIWIRVSTEDQVKGESPQHHERRARAYAESKGWNVATVYNLEALSGKSVMGFPETQRMLADVRAGSITGIIFSKLARLARNTRELLDFADIFRECDADLVSLQESIDTSTPAGRLFYTMIAAMAQWEREEIADRVAASVPIRAKMGKPLGGAAPFGYRWEGRELKLDEKEAPVRRLMYDLFLKNRRKKAVARMLNEAGHRTRNGSLFTNTTIDRLLRDPIAKGTRRANYTKSRGDGKQWDFKPESEWVLSAVEPLITEDIWNQCNVELDERRAVNKRPAKPAVHPFGKLAWCACGGKMYCLSNSPKYTCRACRNKIPAEDLDAVFREQLKEFFLSSDELTAYIDAADAGMAEKQELIRTAEKELASVQAEMDKIYKLYMGDEITAEGFGRSYKPLEGRRAQLEDRIPTLQAELDFARISNTSRDEIVSQAQDLYARWADLLPHEKREIAEGIVERITIGDGDIAIDLHYAPSRSEIVGKRERNFRDSSLRPASRVTGMSRCD